MQEAHDLDDSEYEYESPPVAATIGYLDYLDELECKSICALLGDACLAFSHRSFKDIKIGSKTVSIFQGKAEQFEKSKKICYEDFGRKFPMPTSEEENEDWNEFRKANGNDYMFLGNLVFLFSSFKISSSRW